MENLLRKALSRAYAGATLGQSDCGLRLAGGRKVVRLWRTWFKPVVVCEKRSVRRLTLRNQVTAACAGCPTILHNRFHLIGTDRLLVRFDAFVPIRLTADLRSFPGKALPQVSHK